MTLLWLDDIRDPMDTQVDWLGLYSPIGKYEPYVVWVKSYDEFVRFITTNGLPDAICFDHDLGKATEKELLSNGCSKEEARRRKGEEKNGFDCAKWLVGYCIDNGLDVPKYGMQTSNPVGRENIQSLLDQYHDFYVREKNRK